MNLLQSFTTASETANLRFVPDPLPSRSSMPSLSVINRDSDHVLLSFSNVMIVLWHGSQAPEVCKNLYESGIALANQAGTGKVAVVSVIQYRATPPSPESREALGRLIEDPNHIVHRSALVYPHDGFLASIVRSIVLTLIQRSSHRRSHQVFQRVDKALEWVTDGLPTATGQPIVATTLLRQLDTYITPTKSQVA